MAMMKLNMVVTDLDGTLLNALRQISDLDYRSLLLLGENKIQRVVATGRSVYSANKVLVPDFPIDYLIFSSGAGIINWQTKKVLYSQSLEPNEVAMIIEPLLEMNLDFMIHKPIPDNHHFLYHQASATNPDFLHRIKIYEPFARPLTFHPREFGAACQLVAIIADNVSEYEAVKSKLSQFNVVRATSPLDGKSIWIEIFPKSVSKASATAWLCARLGCHPRSVLGIGNDYNDLDLLKWTGQSVVVANAPQELKNKFQITDSNLDSGFSKAIQQKFPALFDQSALSS